MKLPDTFCPQAWHMVNITPEGRIKMCCKASGCITQNGKPMSVYEHTYQEIWNSDYMQRIRKSMLEGQPIPECSYCYNYEAKISSSRRLDEIKWGKLNNPYLDESIQDPVLFKQRYGLIAPLPTHLQLDMGNVCNLKCRMCAAHRSTSIEADPVQSLWRPKLPNSQSDLSPTRFPDHRSWISQKDFIREEILADPAQIRLIHISGGEIFLIPEVETIIRFLVDGGYSKQIIFHLTTNATMISDKILNDLSSFKILRIGISVEGIGPINDYIRYPSNWRIIENNIIKLSSLPNTRLYLASTIQIYNVYNFIEVCRYCDQNNLKLYAEILKYPSFFRIGVLPKPVREKCMENYQAYMKTCSNPQRIKMVEYLYKSLAETDISDREELWRRFNLYTNDLDQSRGQSFQHDLHDLYQAILDSGEEWTDEIRYAQSKAQP